MKFFRKKQDTEPIKDVPSGPSDDNMNPAVPSQSQHRYLGMGHNREEAQRRFMQRLYKLSESHGAASVQSLSIVSSLDMSEYPPNKDTEPMLQTSGTQDTSPETSPDASPDSTPETTPTMSPVSSPSRVRASTGLVEQHQEANPARTPIPPPSPAQIEPEPTPQQQERPSTSSLEQHDIPWDFGVAIECGCLLSVLQQICACTDDFFGDKLAGSSYRRAVPQCRRPTVADTSSRGLVEIPSVITFAPSRGQVTDTANSPESKSSKRKYVFEDELDGIIGNYGCPNNPSVAYKAFDREGSALIDNVWVVSSFGGEPEEECVEEIAAVSVTSSISTRNSCILTRNTCML